MRISERKCDCSHLMMPITDYPEKSTLYYPSWDDSGVLTLIYKLNTDGSVVFKDVNLSLHMIDGKRYREVYDLPYLDDGWYKIRSYIFPTADLVLSLGMCNFFNNIEYQNYWKSENPDNMFKENHSMTLALGEDGEIYYTAIEPKRSAYLSGTSYIWAHGDLIDVIDELQTRGIENDFVYGTNIRVIEEDFFTICNLNKCFVNRALSLLDSYRNSCSTGFSNSNKCKYKLDDYEIQIRDYLWMTIHAIKYAVECEDYQTANKLLSCISTCSGVCDNSASDCGCGLYKPLTVTTRSVYQIPSEAYETNIQFNVFDKSEVLKLLNSKQDKLTAGLDIRITDDNVINNEHKFFSNSDILNMWNK